VGDKSARCRGRAAWRVRQNPQATHFYIARRAGEKWDRNNMSEEIDRRRSGRGSIAMVWIRRALGVIAVKRWIAYPAFLRTTSTQTSSRNRPFANARASFTTLVTTLCGSATSDA
jgi:hypothetical protein